MTEKQFKDNKTKACIENKKNCVRDSIKDINGELIDIKVQESANEQFKNIKKKNDTVELSASEQKEMIQSEPNSTCENTH